MAQTKTRAPAKKRSQGSRKAKPQARARGSSNNGKTRNGKPRAEAALHTVEGKAKDAGHAVGNAASKARMPLVATGAALAGAAGGLALGARHGRRHKVVRRPLVKVRSRDLAKVAKEVGSFSAQMGQVASELQHARNEVGSQRHRSPVEVVLEGLTARRSRA